MAENTWDWSDYETCANCHGSIPKEKMVGDVCGWCAAQEPTP